MVKVFNWEHARCQNESFKYMKICLDPCLVYSENFSQHLFVIFSTLLIKKILIKVSVYVLSKGNIHFDGLMKVCVCCLNKTKVWLKSSL